MRNQTQLGHLAQEAYQAYAAVVNYTAHDGSVLPFWDDVRPEIKAAWERAVLRIDELLS